MSSNGIRKPHHNDVLCGRGSSSRDHPGNGQFRSFVKALKEECVVSHKSDKPRFAGVIVGRIRFLQPPGRFLKLGCRAKGQDPRLWYEIGDKEAIRKTRQALREEAKQIRECLKYHDESLSDSSVTQNPNIIDENVAHFNSHIFHHAKTSDILKDALLMKQNTSNMEKMINNKLEEANEIFLKRYKLLFSQGSITTEIPLTPQVDAVKTTPRSKVKTNDVSHPSPPSSFSQDHDDRKSWNIYYSTRGVNGDWMTSLASISSADQFDVEKDCSFYDILSGKRVSLGSTFLEDETSS